MTTAVTRLFLLVSMFFMSMGLQAATERESITLWSEGVRLAGDLVKPAGLASADKLPGILMVPGWGEVRPICCAVTHRNLQIRVMWSWCLTTKDGGRAMAPCC